MSPRESFVRNRLTRDHSKPGGMDRLNQLIDTRWAANVLRNVRFQAPRMTQLSSVIVITTIYLLWLGRSDYVEWKSMGPGGLPYNFKGWMINNWWRLKSKETKSTQAFKDKKLLESCGDAASEAWLDETEYGPLPSRRGERPTVYKYAAPHRQRSDQSSKDVRRVSAADSKLKMSELIDCQVLIKEIDIVAQSNIGIVEIKTSLMEKRGLGFYRQPSIPPRNQYLAGFKTDFAHLHADADGSGHMLLSPRDATLVIEKGWGERHGLSGVMIAATYMLIYAPRNEEENKIWLKILKASIAFVTGQKPLN